MATTTSPDPATIEEAYARYSRFLLKIAYAVVRDRPGAEDCVHEVLVRLLARPGRFNPGRGRLKSFLAVCVRNEAIARMRRTHRRMQIEKGLSRAPLTETFEIRDYLDDARLDRALRALPGDQYEAIELFYFGSLSHPQISKMLGIPLGTVKTRIKLAIRRMSRQPGLDGSRHFTV